MDIKKNITNKMIGITSNVITDRIGLDGYDLIADAGFDSIDFNMERGFFSIENNTFPEDFYDIILKHKEKIKECGLKVGQSHGPFYLNGDFLKNDDDLEKYFMSVEQALRASVILECEIFVVHPLHKLYWMTSDSISLTRKLLERLYRIADKAKIHICLENLPYEFCGDYKKHMYYISAFEDLQIKACFDLGHSLICNEVPVKHLINMREHIFAVHLHDNDGKKDLHERINPINTYWKPVIREIENNDNIQTISLETSSVYKKCNIEDIRDELKKDINSIIELIE